MSAAALAVQLARQRLSTLPAAVAALSALIAVVVVALLERRQDITLAADRALTGIVFGIVVPLLAYAAVDRAANRQRLEVALGALARHGANRRTLALGLLAGAALPTALFSALLAAIAVIAARGVGDPALVRDVMFSSSIGVAAAIAYCAWFGLGSIFGRGSNGRVIALVVDWLLGSGTTALALPWPRGHVRNLLGAEPVLQLPQWGGQLALAALTAVYLALTLLRCRR